MKISDSLNDTIAAISSGIGGAIGIIRLSGPDAIKITGKIFRTASGSKIDDSPTHTIHYGDIIENSALLDRALASVMKKPGTYTGEDVVEISVHNSRYIINRVLNLCLANGARAAARGEFTKRAFLNGKMDLAQAEAVCELINADNKYASAFSFGIMKGALSNKIKAYKDNVLTMAADFEAVIDNPEEGVQIQSREHIVDKLDGMAYDAEQILNSFILSGIIKQGLNIGIMGRVNAGKSSLFNAFILQEKAIVSGIPGTTRDAVESEFVHNGIPLRICDTAGIRSSSRSSIEQASIRKTRASIDSHDNVFFVIDASRRLSMEDRMLAKLLISKKPPSDIIILLNKADLKINVSVNDARSLFDGSKDIKIIKTSALKKQGIRETLDWVCSEAKKKISGIKDGIAITNSRHAECLNNFIKSLKKARELFCGNAADIYVVSELRAALSALDELTGQTTSQDIINSIFERFCIGK